VITVSCPPNGKRPVADDYNDISIHSYTVTGPGGTITGPPDPTKTQNLPVRPPYSYLLTSVGVIEDPASPTFLQDGELLIGSFEEGTNSQLTVKVFDLDTKQAISGATVTAFNATTSLLYVQETTDSSRSLFGSIFFHDSFSTIIALNYLNFQIV